MAEPLKRGLELHGFLAGADHQHARGEAVGTGEHALTENHETGECQHEGVQQDFLHASPAGHEVEGQIGGGGPHCERRQRAAEEMADGSLAVRPIQARDAVGAQKECRENERRREHELRKSPAMSLQPDSQDDRPGEPARFEEQLDHGCYG